MSDQANPHAARRAGLSMLAPLGVAIGYWLAATISLALTRGGDGIAAMWPSSGVLLAGLLWMPGRRGWVCLGWTALASIVANLHADNHMVHTLWFTAANLSEAVVAARIIAWTGERRLSFIDPRDVGRFFVASLAAAAWSAAVASVGVGSSLVFAASWFVTVLLGILVVTPAVLIAIGLVRGDESVPMPVVPAIETALLILLVAGATGIAFAQDMPMLFLPLVALLGTTYRLGPMGAALGVLVVALVGSLLTGLGYGLIAANRDAGPYAVFVFQFFLLLSFATALPLAALLAAQRRLAAQCAASERMHRLLADASSDIIARLTPAGEAIYMSSAVTRMLGYAPGALAGDMMRVIHPDDRAIVDQAWADMLAAGEDRRFVFRARRRSGDLAWLEAACRLTESPDGAPEVVAAIRDITERHAAEAATEAAVRKTIEANRLLGMAERVAQVGHWRKGSGQHEVFWSPELFRIHGVEGTTPPGLQEALEFYHPDDRERVTRMVDEGARTGAPFETTGRLVLADGSVRHVVLRGQPELDDTGTLIGLFGVLQDVTRQVLVERELDAALQAAEAAAARAIHMADTDMLTGIASRRRALTVLDEAIEAAEASGAPLALAIFDIDHFKAVNDRWGHGAGDTVLRRVARAAAEAVRPTDLVGRLGGEEFVVVLPGLGQARAVALAETLRRAIEASAVGPDAGPAVTASIGLALHVPGSSAASLLGDADRALYWAKSSGRNAARLAA